MKLVERVKHIIEKYSFLLILVLGTLVYANTFLNGFVLDDIDLIVNNSLLQSKNIITFFLGGTFYHGDVTALAGQFYRPIMMAIFALVYSLFGPNAFFFHLLPFCFHIINVILVMMLLRLYFSRILSFLLASIFLVYPVNSETVANIAHLNEILFVTFGLIAVIVAFKIGNLGKIKGGFLLSGLLLFSLLSKETGILFSFLIVGLYLIFKIKNMVLLISPVFAGLIYIFLRLTVAKVELFHKGVSPIMRASLEERLITIPKMLFFYLKAVFYPISLSTSQHWVVKSSDFGNFFLPLIVAGALFFAVGIFIFNLMRNDGDVYRRLLFFYLLWFVLGILFHLQFFPLEYTVAERWLYFPLIGLLGTIGVVFKLVRIPDKYKAAIFVIALSIIAAFSLRTIYRNFQWKNNLVLASHDILVNKDSFELELLLGSEQIKSKDYRQAIVHIQKSVDLNPYWLNINNLATAYLGLGDTPKALELFKKSAYEYHYYKSFENLASVNLFDGNLTDAKKALDDGLQIYPNDPKLWQILALYFEKTEDKDKQKQAQQKYLYLKKRSSSQN